MSEIKTGSEVVEQARDTSFWNTEPLVAKAAVTGFTGSALIALGAFGLVTEDQRTIIVEQVGNITYGVFVLVPMGISVATAIWARLSTFSPRTAAKIAIVNANLPAGSAPTLLTPP